jgi:hypothetical protein
MFQHHQDRHCPQADDQRKFNAKKSAKTGGAFRSRLRFVPFRHGRGHIQCTRVMQSMDEESERVCLVFWPECLQFEPRFEFTFSIFSPQASLVPPI